MKEYLEKIVEILNRIETEEAEKLSAVADKVCEVIKNDGLMNYLKNNK